MATTPTSSSEATPARLAPIPGTHGRSRTPPARTGLRRYAPAQLTLPAPGATNPESCAEAVEASPEPLLAPVTTHGSPPRGAPHRGARHCGACHGRLTSRHRHDHRGGHQPGGRPSAPTRPPRRSPSRSSSGGRTGHCARHRGRPSPFRDTVRERHIGEDATEEQHQLVRRLREPRPPAAAVAAAQLLFVAQELLAAPTITVAS